MCKAILDTLLDRIEFKKDLNGIKNSLYWERVNFTLKI